MACQLTLADDWGVRGRSSYLSQCMPIRTHPMGIRRHSIICLSLCMSIRTHPGSEWPDGSYGV